ncbi:MAG TPA: flagellar basal-body MS-ring/collar protein FliF [Acetobacteraceae bacterium]
MAAVGTLGILPFLTLHRGAEHFALLYSELDLREAAQIADSLDRQHIAHQIGRDGTQILVPADDVARARLLLAKESLPSGGSIGYEIFDRGDRFTANQFQQNINQLRALEGELGRTIRAIDGVRAARVHLVLAKREPFARDRQEAQASVMLTTAGAARLDRENVQAIVNLVAAAVPGLRPGNISVVHSRGELLARAGDPANEAGTAASAEELRHGIELRMSRSVEELLERTLGPGHVRAEV